MIYAIALSVAVLLTAAACDSRGEDTSAFTLTVTLPAGTATDSLSLSLVRDDYNAVQHIATIGHTRADSTRFFLRGNLDASRIAFIDITGENRLKKKLYFILEPGASTIAIDTATVIITGGPQNRVYTTFLRERHVIVTAIDENRRGYLKACHDSTLTQKYELHCLRQDSILNDSLQQFTLHAMTRRGLPATLIRHHYYHTLDSLHRQK